MPGKEGSNEGYFGTTPPPGNHSWIFKPAQKFQLTVMIPRKSKQCRTTTTWSFAWSRDYYTNSPFKVGSGSSHDGL